MNRAAVVARRAGRTGVRAPRHGLERASAGFRFQLGLCLGIAFASASGVRADGPVEALQRGLSSPSLDVRVAALTRVAKSASDLTPDQRRKDALILRKVIVVEPEVAARMAVIEALAALRDDVAWVPVVQASLADRDDGVRAAATTALLLGGSDCVAALGRLLREDQDETFRAEVALLLGRRRRVDAVPVLLEALIDAHARVRTAAAEALEAVSGEALGYEPAPWKAWWEARRVPAAPARPIETVTSEPAARTPPPPPPPPRALVPEVYGLRLTSKDVVFIVDVSGSVGDEGVQSAKTEILKAVERFASDVRFAAVFFDAEVRTWHPEMVAATPATKGEFSRYVKGFGRGKRTDVMTALNVGLGIVRRRVDAKREAKESFIDPVTMVVVSDGQENLRATPGAVVGDHLDRLDLAHAVVHAIAVGGRDNALLAALARRGGGSYRVAP